MELISNSDFSFIGISFYSEHPAEAIQVFSVREHQRPPDWLKLTQVR